MGATKLILSSNINYETMSKWICILFVDKMARNNNFPLALNTDLLQEYGTYFDKFYQKVRSILNSAEKDSLIAALSDSPYDKS